MSISKHVVAAGALVYNEDGHILLVRHAERGWEIPGGYVNTGEDLITAVQREVKEETGIEISVGQLAGIYQNVQVENAEIPTKVIFDFLASKQSGTLRTSHEHIEVKWFARDEVLEKITHPIYHDRMKHMLNFSGKVLLRVYSKTPYKIHREVYM
jgi:8-oxo-dGTP diphosphatase